MNHCMLEVSTPANSLRGFPEERIIAIECVFFDPETGGIGQQYYRVVNIADENNVVHMSHAYFRQLMMADSRVRSAVLAGDVSEKEAVMDVCKFISANTSKSRQLHCWQHGDGTSLARLIMAVEDYGCSPSNVLPQNIKPAHLSTLITVAAATGYVPHPRRDSAQFTLTDAAYRAEQVCEIWQRLTEQFTDLSE
ncbi:hypothetical protein GTGU_03604 [Trabulsiella guamensis ATCC 49490]|uniref:3'-5' exoribonuclease Rv2179c-like domain-containing protein n=2 Tax=Trabulsiella guamensis TaxID=158852 RepID=A0A084ZUE2_9ENTR|nr:hypothetical protein GTGU_03604 [Trabulsiella guamensis ATCC 49490]